MGRAAAAGALAALALLAGACGSARSTTAFPGYTVYSLLPLQGVGAQRSRDVVDGERLALHDAAGRAGGLTLNFRSLDTSGGGRPGPSSSAVAANVVVTDAGALAAIGALDGEEAVVEAPLLNAGRTALVSPGATYTGLTTARGAAPGEPERLRPTGRPNFVRLVGSDLTQAPALAELARRGGCRRVATVAGRDAEERSLAQLFVAAARMRGLRASPPSTLGRSAVTPSADCAAVIVSTPRPGARLVRALHRVRPSMKLVLPSTMCTSDVAPLLDPAAPSVRILCPLAATRLLASPARAFAARFRTTFGRPPSPYALLGYDAMRTVLAAIRHAGRRAGDPAAVTRALVSPGPRPSLAGPATTLPSGDTAPARWSQAVVRGGRLVIGPRVASGGP